MSFTRLLLCFCLIVSCVGATIAAEKTDSEAIAVVERQLAAFNRHDADALASGVSEDFVWYSVASDSTTIESKGRETLREGMKAYFKSFPDVSSKIEGVAAAGAFVSFRETVSWTARNGPRSQTSIGVYEVHGAVIVRVWYYPATR